MADASLSVELQAKITNFVNGMRKAASETEGAGKRIDKAVDGISKGVTSKLAGVFSAAAFVSFGKAVLDVTAEFQKFNAVLGNTLGSASLATLKLREIQDFAAKTPFGINELTGAFVKLANSGFKPTGDQMRALGDLASSTGKSFDQLAEAILDAQSGEFERLKEFGVRAKDAGDSVIFTYKGVQTQVEKTSVAIRDYITNLGNAEGVSGSMAKISETLGGQISNLGDNWDKMLLSVGNNTTGVFNGSISVISKAIEKVTQYNEELEIASKYKLDGDFLQQLNRAVNPFANKGATKKELEVFGIKQANEEVGKFVSNALAAAKSTTDFGKALAQLKIQGDKALISPGIGSEKERKGISDAYQLGVKAIQDARNNFAKEGDAAANFGTAKAAKNVKTLSSVLKELGIDLEKSGNQFKSTFSEENEARINAYQKAIDDLISLGYDKASASVIKLKKEQQGLFQLDAGKVKSFTEMFAEQAAKRPGDPKLYDNKDKELKIRIPDGNIIKDYKRILDYQKQFNTDFQDGFNQLKQGAIADAIGGGFSSIGEAMVNGGSIIEAAGNALLGTLGSFLNELGQMLIKKGLATVLAGTALNFLFPGAGAKTTAGGFGLIAAGAALSLGSGIIGAGRTSPTSSRNNNNNGPTAFANGGIVSGPTNALIGEYAGARNNPEVVAPLSKLKSMIGGGEQIYIAENVIRGQDIVTIYKKASSTLRRVN